MDGFGVFVTYYHRRPLPQKNFSIERVFEDVRKIMPEDIKYSVAVSRFHSRGFWSRLYNIIEAPFRQGDINHITGDVHFLSFLLRKKRTLLSIMDCGTLERLRGFKKFLVFFFWYWLPEKRVFLISVISDSSKRELLKYLRCNPKKIRVIHCPVPDIFYSTHKVFNAQKPVILQVGTGENKNILRVAEALKGISSHFRIIGELNDNQVQVLKDCGIEYSTAINISDEELVMEYQKCDMVIFASTYEGFGLPIVEANATGRPIVTSNIYSMPEVAGDAACLVNPLDVESIRAGILRVIHDSKYREELVSNGFRNIERFRPQIIASQYVELYKELLGSNK